MNMITTPIGGLRVPLERVAAAQILEDQAARAPRKLANVLHICATAISIHPDPIGMCLNNAKRMLLSRVKPAGDIDYEDIIGAAGAFEAAATVLTPSPQPFEE